MIRLSTIALALLAVAGCSPGPRYLEVEEVQDEAGATFISYDPAAVEAVALELGLPAPDPPLVRLERGLGMRFSGAFAKAQQERSAASFGELGMLLHQVRRTAAARACYERAHELDPTSPVWPHYLGDLAEARGDLEEARSRFEEAAELAPDAVPPRTRLARVLRDLGENQALAIRLAELLGLDPGSLFANTELAALALDAGETEGVESLLERAEAEWPNQRRVHVLLARLYDLTDRPELARRHRGRAERGDEMSTLVLDPWRVRLEAFTDSVLYWKTGARELFAAGRWAEVLPILEQLEVREPAPEWTAKRAQALVAVGRVPEGREVARRLTESHPDSALGLAALAFAETSAGRHAEAVAAADRALALDDRSWLAHEAAVKALVELGEGEGALARIAGLRERMPDEVLPLAFELIVRRALAEEALDDERVQEAAVHLAQARETHREAERLAPGDPRTSGHAEWIESLTARLR